MISIKPISFHFFALWFVLAGSALAGNDKDLATLKNICAAAIHNFDGLAFVASVPSSLTNPELTQPGNFLSGLNRIYTDSNVVDYVKTKMTKAQVKELLDFAYRPEVNTEPFELSSALSSALENREIWPNLLRHFRLEGNTTFHPAEGEPYRRSSTLDSASRVGKLLMITMQVLKIYDDAHQTTYAPEVALHLLSRLEPSPLTSWNAARAEDYDNYFRHFARAVIVDGKYAFEFLKLLDSKLKNSPSLGFYLFSSSHFSRDLHWVQVFTAAEKYKKEETQVLVQSILKQLMSRVGDVNELNPDQRKHYEGDPKKRTNALAELQNVMIP